MKKIALTSVFANLTYNDKNHRGLEAMFIKKMMEEKGAQVDCVGYKNRNMKDLDFYHNYTDNDFSEYGAVIVQLSTPNFFGGVMGEHCETICNNLAKFKGKIYTFKDEVHKQFMSDAYLPSPKVKPNSVLINLLLEKHEVYSLQSW